MPCTFSELIFIALSLLLHGFSISIYIATCACLKLYHFQFFMHCYNIFSFFFVFWASCWNHCLAEWIGHWMTTWLTGCSSATYSQAAQEAIPLLYKQERKRPTPARRQLSWTQALLGRIILLCGCWCGGWKCGVLWGCSTTPHSTGNPPSAPHVCCCCQINR